MYTENYKNHKITVKTKPNGDKWDFDLWIDNTNHLGSTLGTHYAGPYETEQEAKDAGFKAGRWLIDR
jgi:hypothetical protein